MARDARYKVSKKRRREGKTNYHKRYIMLKSMKIRVVIRRTNKYIVVQFIYPTPIGDFTIAAAHSHELVKLFGWKMGTKNTATAYLTGLLAGLRAIKLGITYAIPDIGLYRPVKGGRIFATIKGIKDAGVEIPCDESIFPAMERISGEAISRYAKMLIETNPEKYQRLFSNFIKNGVDPTTIPKYFEATYNKIISIYNSISESSEAKKTIEELTATTSSW